MKIIARTLLLAVVLFSTASAKFIGIPEEEFRPHYREQQTSMWCWAASAEMVLSYQGIALQQGAIVERIRGAQLNAGASPREMIQSTNGVFTTKENRSAVVSGQYVVGNPDHTVLFTQLQHKRPVILTYQNGPTSGHAVVLTGIEVSLTGAPGLPGSMSGPNVTISGIHVFDPFPYVQKPMLSPYGQPMFNGFGQPLTQLVRDKEYRAYSLTPQMAPVQGIISGVILMDGSLL